jgi:hypothetical protein
MASNMNREDLPQVLCIDHEPRIVDDLRPHVGTLSVPKGFEVTETCLARLRNVGPGILQERVASWRPNVRLNRLERQLLRENKGFAGSALKGFP